VAEDDAAASVDGVSWAVLPGVGVIGVGTLEF